MAVVGTGPYELRLVEWHTVANNGRKRWAREHPRERFATYRKAEARALAFLALQHRVWHGREGATFRADIHLGGTRVQRWWDTELGDVYELLQMAFLQRPNGTTEVEY